MAEKGNVDLIGSGPVPSHLTLPLLQEADTLGHTIIQKVLGVTREGIPAVVGDGATTYHCGGCGNIILKNVRPEGVRNMVFKCDSCDAYNYKD
jgi:hypothetical protein